ncbi:hypothetical protein ACE10Z_21265 [Bradyrhizobium sp. Pha-3]|uniref:hypothetical protein n=1 Tax=Bradyrhizobium sp. Pha-3 TaxID=208375 RepID=UPI0035D40D9E
MTTLTGNSRQKTFSGSSEAAVGALTGFGVCLVAGGLVWAVDAWLRLPLHLPGWRGLIVMAILVTARGVTGLPWAASAAVCSAAVVGFAAGNIGPHGILIYVLPGLIIDALGLIGPAWRSSLLRIGLSAGVANAAKFIGILAFGAGFRGVGLLMPLSSHFLFGVAGGVIAAVLLMRWRGK